MLGIQYIEATNTQSASVEDAHGELKKLQSNEREGLPQG